MIHKTDRNIVLASSLHNALDINFGPSDDDFHYSRHHATVAHDGVMVDGNPMDIKLIFQGGGCEVQWATGEHVRDEHRWDGYVQISPDGKMSFPFWKCDGLGNQEEPLYVEFDTNGLRIYNHEGEPADEHKADCLMFDSSKARYYPDN